MNNVSHNINGAFENIIPHDQIVAPCWKSTQTNEAKTLQQILDTHESGFADTINGKIKEFARDDHFFRLTEGKFYEVQPGDYKDVKVKIQVKEGTITWYFAEVGHDETTQEFRNQIFRTASLGHLLVDGACSKYYRGTNAMHVKRMHTSEEEAQINHNHYRVSDNHVTPSQFKQHLDGFLEAQKAYKIENKFLTLTEATELAKKYEAFDNQLNVELKDLTNEDGTLNEEKIKGINTKAQELTGKVLIDNVEKLKLTVKNAPNSFTTLREVYHEQEQAKWDQEDLKELQIGHEKHEIPCEAKELTIPLNETPMKIPLNETPITIPEKTVEGAGKEITIFPKDWIKHPEFSKAILDRIAKVGSEGLDSKIAHTRQLKTSKLPTQLNAYTELGELFDQAQMKMYPPVDRVKTMTT